MLDKISKALYFIFIIIITYILITVAQVSKTESFIEEQLDILQISTQRDLDLIQTVSLTYGPKPYEAYIYEKPIFKENYELTNNDGDTIYKFELVFYKYIQANKKENNNFLAMLINDIEINDKSVFLTDREQPVIDIDISYDKSFVFGKQEFDSSVESFQSYEGLNSHILLINYNFFKTDNSYVNFKQIDFKYRILAEELTYKPLLTLYNEDYFDDSSDVIITDSIKSDINRSLKSVHSDFIVFHGQDLESLKLTSDFYHDNSIKKRLAKNNIYYVKYLGSEFIVVLIITYLLFFHKDVMVIVNNRRSEKKRKVAEMKSKLLKKEEEK